MTIVFIFLAWWATPADAQDPVKPDIAITAVDFGAGTVTLTNHGATTASPDGLWLCNFPAYAAISGVGDLAPGASASIPISVGADASGGELGLFAANPANPPTNRPDFGESEFVVSYVEWGPSAGVRSGPAVAAGVWDGERLPADADRLTARVVPPLQGADWTTGTGSGGGNEPTGPGYWTVEADGDVAAFGGAPDLPGSTQLNPAETAVAVAAHPAGTGLWILTSDNRVIARGSATDFGNPDTSSLQADERLTTIAANGDGSGVWVFSDRGRILALGAATPSSQMAQADVVLGLDLAGGIVGAAPTATGLGVYMVGSDGGVFAVGDADFRGSVPGVVTGPLVQPVIGIVTDPDGEGYWMVAADGGVFAFDAVFASSLPAIVPFDQLAAPVNGMVPFGNGYLLVASDGGVFVFSDLPFQGSSAGVADSPVVGVAPVSGP